MMTNKKKKPVVGIFGLSSDEGCVFTILDQGEKFFRLLNEVELGECRLLEDLPEPQHFDVALVEGSVLTQENIDKLKWIRAHSRILVALGACAIIGGIPELKNYADKDKAVAKVYKNVAGIDNLEVKPLKSYVKVDFEIPGCPADGGEVIRFLYDLKEGKIPKLEPRPVCYECQLRETECLLQPNARTGRKALPCMGPITQAGCDAPCPVAGYPCDGCRGVLAAADFANFERAIQDLIPADERDQLFERYGNKDEIDRIKRARSAMKK